MFEKPVVKKVIVYFMALCLLAGLLVVLPDIWFKLQLKKDWNVAESTATTTLGSGRRHRLCLIFALDGVPYDMIRELQAQGWFKGFYPPGRLVSTFPSLTRPAFSKMLIGGKPYGYERLYYNFTTRRLEGAALVKKAFSTQKKHADYHPKLHFLGFPGYIAYVFPDKFTQAALDGFTSRLRTFQGDEFIAYMGMSDAIAHVEGEAALRNFLKKISILLDSVRNDLGIPMDVVLFSDHANNFSVNRWADLSTPLIRAGFQDVDQLKAENDFVLPQNGFVSFAAIYTKETNAPAMAMALSTAEGVDFSVYRWQQAAWVHGASGIARIDRRGHRFRYTRITGDPLDLAGTIDRLNRLGKADNQQFFHEKDWWQATTAHVYPDPLRRIWEGLHDLVQHSGSLLVSLKNGYAFGPRIFSQSIIHPRAGTHGALLANHSYGFLMTDFMPVKPANRPTDVAGLLARSAEAKQTGQRPHAATPN